MKLKKKTYLQPKIELFQLNLGISILEALSLEGNVDDITEGENLHTITEW